MALDPVTNWGKCDVNQGYDAATTSIGLAAGDGDKLPDPSSDGSFNFVWWNFGDYPDPSDDPNREIVRCTSRTGDTLTILRGQEGRAASSKNTPGGSYKILLGGTKKLIDDIDAHIIDDTLHFTESSIIHGNIDADSLLVDDHTIYILADGSRAFTGNVTLTSTGDIDLIIEADSDNTGEEDNPRLVLRQDGNAINGLFGINGTPGARYSNALVNATYIESQRAGSGTSLQFVTGATTIGGVDGVARMTILNDGKTGFGTNNPLVTLDINVSRVAIEPDLTKNDDIIFTKNSTSSFAVIVANDGDISSNFKGVRARGTLQVPTAIQSGDRIVSFSAKGWDGSNLVSAGALIDFKVDDTVSSGIVPTQISFVTGTNSSARQERLTIKSTGLIGINEDLPDAMVEIAINSSTEEGLKIRGSASQTADLFIATDSSDNIGCQVRADFTLKNLGGRITNITEVTTSTYTVLSTNYHISIQYTDTGTQTTTLPALSTTNHGQVYHFKDADYNARANSITIATTGVDTIDESATAIIINSGTCLTVIGNNTTKNWEIQ